MDTTRERARYFISAGIGTCFVAVTQMLQPPISAALTYGIIAFAMAMPILFAALLCDVYAGHHMQGYAEVCGFLLVLAGLVAMFFHFGTTPGWIFLASCFGAFVIVGAGMHKKARLADGRLKPPPAAREPGRISPAPDGKISGVRVGSKLRVQSTVKWRLH